VQRDRIIDVVANADGEIACATCQEVMGESEMCLLLRKRPGGPFDALCLSCARTVIRWASVEAATILSNF
jgi:hypothetical protein